MKFADRDTQQVCENGHQITDTYHQLPDTRRKRCRECGANTIYKCQHCNTEIVGGHYGLLSTFTEPVPDYCEECGEQFPWVDAGIKDKGREGRDAWWMVHPRIQEVSESRIASKHYADAVEVAMKLIVMRVKERWLSEGKKETDGADLMFKAFGGDKPVVRIAASLKSRTGENIQEGYKHIFAGAIRAIRNPNPDNARTDV